MFQNILELYKEEAIKKEHSYDYLKLFKHIKENQIYYKTMQKLKVDFSKYNDNDLNEKEALKYLGHTKNLDYHIEFFKAGMNAIINKWLENECQETPEEMVQIIKNEYQKKKYKYIILKCLHNTQRVALIRTLAIMPDILLLDEPFSALDYQTRLALSDDLYKIIKNENKTAIMVTHDIAEAISMSDRIIVLTKRPGSIKNIYEIKLNNKSTPTKNRKDKEFIKYYDMLWKELDHHV